MYQVSLKKAHDLERIIKETADKTVISGTIQVSIYKANDLEEQIVLTQKEIEEQFSLIIDLVSASYEIRTQKQAANSVLGIDKLIGQRKMIETQESKLNAIIAALNPGFSSSILGRRAGRKGSAKIQTNSDVIEITQKRIATMLARITSTDQSGYNTPEDTLNVNAVSPDFMASLQDRKATLTRQKTDIQDQLSVLNLSNKINISLAVETLLRNNKIID